MKNLQTIDLNAPSRSFYIGAWLLMGTINLILSHVINLLLPFAGPSLVQNPLFWQVVVAPVTATPIVIAFYLTYGVWFKSLNGWRVLPWLYVIGTLGFFASTGNSLPVLEQVFDQKTAEYFLGTSLVSWFIALFVIKKFIVAKSDHVK